MFDLGNVHSHHYNITVISFCTTLIGFYGQKLKSRVQNVKFWRDLRRERSCATVSNWTWQGFRPAVGGRWVPRTRLRRRPGKTRPTAPFWVVCAFSPVLRPPKRAHCPQPAVWRIRFPARLRPVSISRTRRASKIPCSTSMGFWSCTNRARNYHIVVVKWYSELRSRRVRVSQLFRSNRNGGGTSGTGNVIIYGFPIGKQST